MLEALDGIADRWHRYEAAEVSRRIADHDAMFDGHLEHYVRVGRSAVELIAVAMLAAGKTEINSVLDLPCGAGRVTRHLRLFFPEADLFVSDLDKCGQRFAAETFGAMAFDVSPDFAAPPDRCFDLVFVGSLLTHLPEDAFVRALDWFVAALAPEGLVVLTLHGRRAEHAERHFNRFFDPTTFNDVRKTMRATGFGFLETERREGASYGYCLTAPSWVLRLAEQRHARIVGYQEAAWSDHQDALVLQRAPLDGPYRG